MLGIELKGGNMTIKLSCKRIINIIIIGLICSLSTIFPTGRAAEGNLEQKSDKDSQTKSDTVQLIISLKNSLESEINHPSSYKMPVGSYVTISQGIVRNIIFKLAELGPKYANYIYRACADDTSKAATVLKIALGLMKESRVHESLRMIVSKETDPNLRAMAVRALSKYEDSLDVPIFAQAVSDTHVVVMEMDVAAPDGQFHKLVNMVGMEAVPALYELGYKPVFDSISGNYGAIKLDSLLVRDPIKGNYIKVPRK